MLEWQAVHLQVVFNSGHLLEQTSSVPAVKDSSVLSSDSLTQGLYPPVYFEKGTKNMPVSMCSGEKQTEKTLLNSVWGSDIGKR